MMMQTCNSSNIAPVAEVFYDNAKILLQECSQLQGSAAPWLTTMSGDCLQFRNRYWPGRSLPKGGRGHLVPTLFPSECRIPVRGNLGSEIT